MKLDTKQKRKFLVAVSASVYLANLIREIVGESDELLFQQIESLSALLGDHVENSPDMILYEVQDRGEKNEEMIAQLRQHNPSTVIYVLSRDPAVLRSVDFLKLGATDCFAFPSDRRKFIQSLEASLDWWRASLLKESFLRYQSEKYDFSRLIGSSPELRDTLRLAQKVIESNFMTVLILGETGTGKELLAKAVHYNSMNRDEPFVEIACSAIPEPLLESELFGHEKGAFTDAREQKIGLFELAGRGTIFLDEIGDISLRIQSKLVKVIEEKVMRRVGGTQEIPVNARIIAATSRNLEDMVKAGEFRVDLYHRLRILPLRLSPLRERGEDIPLLAEGFIKQFAEAYHKQVKGISEDAQRLLIRRRWEGNVRELKHSIERAVLLCEGEWIKPNDFDFSVDEGEPFESSAAGSRITLDFGRKRGEMLHLSMPFGEASLDAVSKLVVKQVLRSTRGNKSRAARILGISRPKIDRMINRDPAYFKDVV